MSLVKLNWPKYCIYAVTPEYISQIHCNFQPCSFSEPSLFSPGENVVLCGNHHRPSSVRKRLPPSHQPPSRSSSLTSGNALDPWRKRHSDATPPLPCQNQNYRRRIYTHFSQPIRPSPKAPPSSSLSDSMTRTSPETRSELRPSVMPYGRSSSDGEALSVVGRPYLPGCCQTLASVAASLPPKRTQLHVFLPTGDRAGEEDGEEADSESVDEGFMDELDSKITALRLQRPKAAPDHWGLLVILVLFRGKFLLSWHTEMAAEMLMNLL